MRLTRADAARIATAAATKDLAPSTVAGSLADREERALRFIDGLFAALTNHSVNSTEAVAEWKHRLEPLDMLRDSTQLGINREQLRAAAGKYLETPWLAAPELDWLVADTLMYAESLASFDSFSAQSLGDLTPSEYVTQRQEQRIDEAA